MKGRSNWRDLRCVHIKRTRNNGTCGFGGRCDVRSLAATLRARSSIQSLMRMIICGSSDDPYPPSIAASPRGRDGCRSPRDIQTSEGILFIIGPRFPPVFKGEVIIFILLPSPADDCIGTQQGGLGTGDKSAHKLWKTVSFKLSLKLFSPVFLGNSICLFKNHIIIGSFLIIKLVRRRIRRADTSPLKVRVGCQSYRIRCSHTTARVYTGMASLLRRPRACARACARVSVSVRPPPSSPPQKRLHDPEAASGDLLTGAVPDRRQTSSLGSHDLSSTKTSLNY